MLHVGIKFNVYNNKFPSQQTIGKRDFSSWLRVVHTRNQPIFNNFTIMPHSGTKYPFLVWLIFWHNKWIDQNEAKFLIQLSSPILRNQFFFFK